MRTILLLLLLFATAHGFAQGSKSYAVFSGRILSPTDSIVSVQKLGLEHIFKTQGSTLSIPIDSLGTFSVNLPVETGQYIKAFDKRMYIQPGDSIYIEVCKDGITYSGLHLEELNEYLQDLPYQSRGPYYTHYSGKTAVSLDADSTVTAMLDRFAHARQSLLDIKPLLPDDIFKLEEKRLWSLALKSSSRIVLAVEYMMRYQISQDSAERIFAKEVPRLRSLQHAAIENLDVDQELLRMEDFTEFTNVFVNRSNIDGISRNLLTEFVQALELNNRILKAESRVQIDEIKNKLDDFKSNTYYSYLAANLAVQYQVYDRDIPNFNFYDLQGNSLSLEDFNGKIIYIDVWATWCGPCIGLRPSLFQLQHRYKDHNDIVILAVTIDKDRSKWLDYLKEKPSPIIELAADKDFEDYFMINAIPRSLIIGSDGKLLEWNALKPNDTKLRAKLDELLII